MKFETIKETAGSSLLFVLSALLVLGFVIHLLTYFGYDLRDHSQTLWWSLQLSSAFAFIPGFLSVYSQGRAQPTKYPTYNTLERVLLGLFGVFLLYAMFNFFFGDAFLNHGSTPEIVNGQYALTSHGSARIITRDEFIRHRIYEARANSGHWMFFYGMCIEALYQKLRRGEVTSQVDEQASAT